jgi:hypothetical protein
MDRRMTIHVDGIEATAAVALFARILQRIKDEPCCIGAAEEGVDACTCWEPIYDLEQQPTIAISVDHIRTRDEMCADCAFRPDSPERQGDERYNQNSDEALRALDHFWCHQGMRKPVAYRHTHYGITLEADHDAYDPPKVIVGAGDDRIAVPFKASGAPGDRCAGFEAWKRIETARA